jgi:hypothetical protein
MADYSSERMARMEKTYMVEYALKGTTRHILKMEVEAGSPEEAKEIVRAKLRTPKRNRLNFIQKVYECESSMPELLALLQELADVNMALLDKRRDLGL